METKAAPPITFLQGKKISPLVEAFFEIAHLKQLYRQGWLKRSVLPENCESVAEHSFSTTLLAFIVADTYFPKLDLSKVVQMALLHDLGEIYAGDLTPSDGVHSSHKQKLERESITNVLEKLPNSTKYLTLWEEFEAGNTAEAAFVRQIDRLEMAFQATVYGAQSLLDPFEFLKSASQALVDPQLQAILEELTDISTDFKGNK